MYSLIQDAINQIHPIDGKNNNTTTNKRSSKCSYPYKVETVESMDCFGERRICGDLNLMIS
jgi:hypothetical protein